MNKAIAQKRHLNSSTLYKVKLTIIFLSLLVAGVLRAQNDFPNTMTFDDGIDSPKADLSATSWIAGHWRGEAFGGITEEVWTSPLGGSMMGSFKLVVDGRVNFYEIITLSEVNNTIVLKLKHFNADLTGWEEKGETVDFKLVKVTPNKVFFNDFTFERISENEINMYVIIESDGKKSAIRFNYLRVK
jgi:uncharacterized protein DUF6265